MRRYNTVKCRCHLCRAASAEYGHLYREANPDKVAEVHRSYDRKHREQRCEANRRYRELNGEKIAERSRAYHVGHLAEFATRQRCRKARKLGAEGTHTAADTRAQYDRQKGRCYWCGAKVAWRKKHVDHVIPLFLGGGNGPENIVVSCSHCNLSNGAKHPMDFAGVLV